MAGKIREITEKEFHKDVLQGGKVVLDFYSTECPPCEALASKYITLSELYGDDITFLKIFRQENRKLAEQLEVSSSPTVIFFNEGQEKGQRLSGGIKRADLIKNLDSLIPETRSADIKKSIKPVMTQCDIAVLGGGPAGLTAGIYSAQAKLNTILIDTALPGGQVTTTHLVSNYPGFEKPVQGFMLMHYMTEQAKEAGVHFRSAVDVNSVDLHTKEIVIDGYETIKPKKIILSTGASYRELKIAGEKEYKGKGISYCATCDAKYYEDKEVIVIGGGNSAIEESLFITKFAKKVTIIHQFDKLQANKVAQELAFANKKIHFMFEHEPREFIKNADGSMTVIAENLKSGKTKDIACDGIFIFAGMKPNIDLLPDELELDEWGYVSVNKDQQTNIPDIFAVGDVASKRYRQITIAVAEGTVAAINASIEIENYDKKENVA